MKKWGKDRVERMRWSRESNENLGCVKKSKKKPESG